MAYENNFYSPLFDILRVTEMFGMLGMAINMAEGSHWYSKEVWKKEVWSRACQIDNQDWSFTAPLFRDTYYLRSTLSATESYLAWWEISNNFPDMIFMCENLARLVCKCSNLNSDNVTLKGTNLSLCACNNCQMFQEEDLEHLVLQCDFNNDIRCKMMKDLQALEVKYNIPVVGTEDLLLVLLGKCFTDFDYDIMMELRTISGHDISSTYMRVKKTKPN